jgi:hypothetical protein
MRKLLLGSLILIIGLNLAPDAVGQFNRKSIKRNNKRIANYTGKKHFGREHVYSGVGFSLNAMNYYGDLSPLPSKFSTDISFTKPGFGISLFHRFGPRYTLVGQFMYGTLKGSDSESAKKSSNESEDFRKIRNASFRNRIKELSLTAYFDLFENEGTYISRVKWTPYVFAGIAAFLHNPQAQAPKTYLDGTPDPYAGQWVDLRPLGTEGQNAPLKPGDANYGIKPYSLLQVAIPFGVGARFRLNEVLDFWADIGFRYTFTDYLDDVSKNYVDLGVFDPSPDGVTPGTFTGKNQLAQAMSYRSNELPGATTSYTYVGRDLKTYNTYNGGFGTETKDSLRGNKKNNDVYMVTSLKITYILGATFHRAKFR